MATAPFALRITCMPRQIPNTGRPESSASLSSDNSKESLSCNLAIVSPPDRTKRSTRLRLKNPGTPSSDSAHTGFGSKPKFLRYLRSPTETAACFSPCCDSRYREETRQVFRRAPQFSYSRNLSDRFSIEPTLGRVFPQPRLQMGFRVLWHE